ncbi:hypothetical protein QJQ45_004527 [Haematococcus lacustris]|nr:hypothetical protein QJQ45_004527 [Haematococcus lacustris]
MQRIGESRWRPLELCWCPDLPALPAKGEEYPGLGYKRLRDRLPKAQQHQEQQQPPLSTAIPILAIGMRLKGVEQERVTLRGSPTKNSLIVKNGVVILNGSSPLAAKTSATLPANGTVRLLHRRDALPTASRPGPPTAARLPTILLLQATVSWDQAPSCITYGKANVKEDSFGHSWAWDTALNRSCAVRSNSTMRSTDFQAAPLCKAAPTAESAKADVLGNLWGWENNASCAFRDASGMPLLLQTTVTKINRRLLQTATAVASAVASSSGSPSLATAKSVSAAHSNGANAVSNATAVATNGTAVSNAASLATAAPNSSATAHTNSISLATQGGIANATMGTIARSEEGRNVYVDKTTIAVDGNTSTYVKRTSLPILFTSSNSSAVSASQATSFESAPACSGAITPTSSQADASGRLWGFENGRSCAFKPLVSNGSAATAAGMSPASSAEVSWDSAPACPHAATDSSYQPDSLGRKWGWNGSSSCKYVDANGNALTASQLGGSAAATAGTAPLSPSPSSSPSTATASSLALQKEMAELCMKRHQRAKQLVVVSSSWWCQAAGGSQAAGGAKQLVVFFGAAGIGTRGGCGAGAVLRACCKVVCRPRGAGQRRGRVVLLDEFRSSRAPCGSQAATQPAASEPGPSSPLPAKRSKRSKAEQAAEPTQPTKDKGTGKGKAA